MSHSRRIGDQLQTQLDAHGLIAPSYHEHSLASVLPAAAAALGYEHVLESVAATTGGAARARSEAAAGEQVDSTGMVNSQIQAIVVRVCVEEGAKVKEGDLLVILESMKMESYVYAPYDGTVTDVVVEGGQNVSAYQPLVRVARAEEEN